MEEGLGARSSPLFLLTRLWVSEKTSSRQFVNRATRSLTLVASSSTKPTSY